MDRIHSVITTTMVALLLTSAAVGAVTNGSVADAVGTVAGTTDGSAPTAADGSTPNGTAPNTTTPNATATTRDANVTARQAVAALSPFLDGLDVNATVERRVLDRATALAADGASPARIVAATYHTLHDAGVPASELRESAWRLRVGMVLAQLDLTAEQRSAVVETVEAERADDAGWRAIRRAAGTQLLDYGVERSAVRTAVRRVRHVELHLRIYRLRQRHQRFHDRVGEDRAERDDGTHPDGKAAWVHRVQHRYDLTDEETRRVVAAVREVRADGGDRADAVAAVHRTLHELGVDHGHDGRFSAHD